jgi:hypothetical protein
MTHRQIAAHLGVCTRTIDFHHCDLNRIFGVNSVVLLLRETVRFQILPDNVLGIHTSELLQRVLN